jgi:hypothetical protein
MNEEINCAQARLHFALLLYGELSFDEEERVDAHLDLCAECRADLERQKSLHAAFESVAIEPPPSLLRECRADLAAALRHGQVPRPATHQGWWDRFIDYLTGGPILRPIGAVALVMVGFLGARALPYLSDSFAGVNFMGAGQTGIMRVSDIEPQTDGSVRIVVDETRQKTVTGGLDDQSIRALLLEAVRDPNNPGLRADSVDLLTRRAQSAEVRSVLAYAVSNDPSDGVRLKAMEGLKAFVSEPEVRGALSRVLLSTANPGVRTQAIDLLVQRPEGVNGSTLPNIDQAMIGTLQELMAHERNASVRQRCEKVLELMNASAEIY